MMDIFDIPVILRRHIAWQILTPVLFAALAFVLVSLKTPEYRTSAELLVQPQGVQVIGNDPASTASNQNLQGMDIDSQIYIILSAAVLNQVANKLDLDNSPVFNRTGLLTRLLGSLSASKRSSGESRDATIAALRKIIQVVRLNRSLVFTIQVSHPDAQLAAAIANETAEAYIRQSHDSRAETLGRASSTLNKQAAQLRLQVDKAEAAVETYKAEHGLISTNSGLVIDQQLEGLSGQITQARVEAERAKSADELMTTLTIADVATGNLPQSVSSSVLTSLRVQYARIAQQEAEAATTLGANHPSLRELRSQLENTKQQIQAELQRIKANVGNQAEQAQSTLKALEHQLDYLQSQNSLQGKALIELRQLQSEADASRAVYEAFLKRSRELGELPALDTGTSRILSAAAVPTRPSGPSKILVLAAAALFGFMISAGVIVGMTLLKGGITSERQLVAQTGIPILGNLRSPKRKSGTPFASFALFGKKGSREPDQSAIAQTRVAYALRQSALADRSANILLLSIGETGDTSGFTRGIAEELHEMGQEVLFAHATGGLVSAAMPETQSPPDPTGIGILNHLASKAAKNRPPAEGASGPAAGGMGLNRYLRVEQIDPRRKYASSGSLTSAGEDFLLVDAGDIDRSPLLPVLLRHCDSIVLITTFEGTSLNDFRRTVAYLAPWQDRILGNVIL